MLQPTPTLTDQVAGQLARAIADGAYAVGAKLPTGRALAQQYGVSAAVIREATERLRAQGLVQSRQGSGCTVVARTPAGGFQVPAGGLDRAHLARVYELRMELEGGAAALAARRRGAADLDRMRQALQALQREPIEPEQGVVHDVGFHVAIATATANPYYLQLLQPAIAPGGGDRARQYAAPGRPCARGARRTPGDLPRHRTRRARGGARGGATPSAGRGGAPAARHEPLTVRPRP